MNLSRRILQSTALLGLAALGASAVGQTQSFAQKTRTVNAAVLLLDSDKPRTGAYVYGQTAAPFAFYNLDSATGTKPEGWVFTNPYAPGYTTHDIYLRYKELGDTIADPDVSGPTPITKRQGAYWTVRLSQLSESQIANYNVLLVAPRYYLSLNPKERELLRRFVDGGGVLWVDLAAAGIANQGYADPSHNLPFAVTLGTGAAASVFSLGSSPLLNGLRQVSDYDLNLLNTAAIPNTSPTQGFSLSATPDTPNNTGLANEFARYRPIVVDGTSRLSKLVPVVSEARVGDGAIVVTARGAAELLNRGGAGSAINTGAPGLSNLAFQSASPTLDAQGRAAARLAVNIVTLGGEGLQPSGSPRKTSGAAAETPAPVLSRFNSEQPAGSSDTGYGPGMAIGYGTTPNAPPVVYKGFLVATVGQRVVVMDAIPGRDLDGDGDPDDGISNTDGTTNDAWRDVSLGKPLDVVWVSNDLGSDLSAPVCAEVPEAGYDASGQSLTDQILVTDASGRLHAFALNLSTTASRFRLVGGVHDELRLANNNQYPVRPPTATTPTQAVMTGHPVPPTVYNGIAYMANTVSGGVGNSVGSVWTVDLSTATGIVSPATGGGNWSLGSSLNLPSFTAEPTIGYIPIADNSGGVDLVMYAPGIFQASNDQPGFASIWLGAKGEVPDSFTITGGTLSITTRAAAAGGVPIYMEPTGSYPSPVTGQLAPHITILDQDGNPVTNQYITSGPTNSGNGVLTYGFNSAVITNEEQFKAANLSIRIDYTIDWGASPTNPSPQIVRGTLRLPIYRNGASVDNSKRILGPIALTAHGTLHMVEATPNGTGTGGDSYFAIREDAGLRGQFRVVSRYTLYSAYTQTFGGSVAGNQVPAVLNDADYIQSQFPPALKNLPTFNTFTNFRYAGGVALRNGIAFTTINAVRAGIIQVAMVAAFRAEPETAELRIGQSVPSNPWLQQTDWARSNPQAVVRTPTSSTLSGNAVVVDADNGIIRIENLATVVNGEITDCLSESQPLGVGSSMQTLAFRQPDAVGDRWSPLLWFALWNGASSTGTPFVGGNTVYLPATSALPDLLNNGTLSYSGVVWSIDADAPTSGLYATTLAKTTNRPWITQQVQLIEGTNGVPGSLTASPYFRMPQIVGISSFDDFKARLNQTRLGSSTTVSGLGGGDGIVTAFTDAGLYGLSRADIIVCDEGRLLQVDSSGNPVVNTFGARFSGIGNGGSVSNQREIPRPVKAYPVGTSDTLVVDAAANRIMRLGGDGSVLRSVERIQLDPKYKPTAYRVNEPLTLKDPRDATTFEGYVYKQGNNEIVSNQQAVEYWIRYLVADSGSGRIVELADRFQVNSDGQVGAPITLPGSLVPDPETGLASATDVAQVGVLVWQSPSLEGAGNIGDYYNSVSRVFLGTAANGRYVYVTGVSRTRPTGLSSGLDNPSSRASLPAGGGGAVVVFDPIGGTRVFDRFAMPTLAGATFFQPDPGDPTQLTGTYTRGTNANVPAETNRSFRGIQAVTAEPVFVNGVASVRTMVTDVDAVYEFDIDANTLAQTTPPGPLPLRWMISEAAFTALRSTYNTTTKLYGVQDNPLSFRPTYARRLDSGEVILVNGYQGLMRDRATAYTGEVALLDGRDIVLAPRSLATNPEDRNLGFTFDNVRLGLRTLTGIRGLVSPVFADRR